MNTGKPIIYMESSVVSYYAGRPGRDPLKKARAHITKAWWDTCLHRYEPVVSQIVVEEISIGDPLAAKARNAAVKNFRSLEINTGVMPIAAAFFAAMKLPERARNDALHLALCLLHNVDYLVSWNLTHISGIHARHKAMTVCRQLGYASPQICTPVELMEE